jgi:fumarate reductase subunit D
MKTILKTILRIPPVMFALLPLQSRAGVLPVPMLAQATGTLKTSMQTGLGVMFLFGFLWGVVKIWSGADRMSKGDADGKMGIVSGIIIAGAAAIMGVLFAIFGMGDGVLTPQF